MRPSAFPSFSHRANLAYWGLVYGPENVSTGATSDLQNATRMATSMVKNYGFSRKLGPVYYTDREDIISPQTRENIDAEVRRCVYILIVIANVRAAYGACA